MAKSNKETVNRKKDHIDLCLNENVGFKIKTNGFEKYEFEHYAITELTLDDIDLSIDFFGKSIAYPFLISCMTGGTAEAQNLNAELALAANQLKIPIGVGSQRQALESSEHHDTYRVVRSNAPNVPILGNIGAAQIVSDRDYINSVKFLIDLIEADAMVIHVNPLQELLQKNGEPNFHGLLGAIEKLTTTIDTPIIVKEVGAGISYRAAQELLQVGVKGIDVAGAGGTSWSGVELIRNNESDDFFHDWGIPTANCLDDVSNLFNEYDFTLLASGGISSGIEIAKAIALGADITASARPILKTLNESGVEGVITQITQWFDRVKKIMYLTGSQNINELNKSKFVN